MTWGRGKWRCEDLLASRLRSCVSLDEGRRIFDEVGQLSGGGGGGGNTFLSNLLVQMFGKLGSVDEARLVFDRIASRNVFSWNMMLAACTRNGQHSSAIRLFQLMDLEGQAAGNGFGFATAIAACSNSGPLEMGIVLHRLVVDNGLEGDLVVGTSLVTMYGRLGRTDQARRVFDRMPCKDVVAWNAMVTAYARNGEIQSGVELFQRMCLDGAKPDSLTLLSIVSGSTSKLVQYVLETAGVTTSFELQIQNALISYYARLGKLDQAKLAFDLISHPDVVSWTSLIAAYAQAGYAEEAMKSFTVMDLEGVPPNIASFPVVASACTSLFQALEVNDYVDRLGLESNVVVATALITMYAACGSLDNAKSLFVRLAYRDLVAWNAMVEACCCCGHEEQALFVFCEMELDGTRPNDLTMVALIDACSVLGKIEVARRIHHRAASQRLVNDQVLTSLIDMYSKCRSLEDARAAFDQVGQRVSVVAWTAVIAAYAQNDRCKEAIDLFRQMQLEGTKPDELAVATVADACGQLGDVKTGKEIHESSSSSWAIASSAIVGTALVAMYSSCGCIDEAKRAFDGIGRRDAIAFSAMIAGYARCGYNAEAIALLKETTTSSTTVTVTATAAAIGACSDLEDGRRIHQSLGGCCLSPLVAAALVAMYARCGSLEDAVSVFEGEAVAVAVVVAAAVTWNAMAAAYAQHGRFAATAETIWRMRSLGVAPDGNTFTAVLQACNHGGMAEEGMECFLAMTSDHGLQPSWEQCACAVDLLARLGRLEEAESVATAATSALAATWNSLLAGCKLQGDVDRGLRAAQVAVDLQDASGPYVLLSHIYGQDATTENMLLNS